MKLEKAYISGSHEEVKSAQEVFEELERRSAAPAVSQKAKRAALISQLDASIEALSQSEKRAALISQSKDVKEDKNMQFRLFGEFVAAARWNPSELRALGVAVGENGGYLVPEQFRTEILRFDPNEAIVRPRVIMAYPAGDAPDEPLNIPVLKQGANGIGGVRVFWVRESEDITLSEPEFVGAKVDPEEMAAIVPVTDKLLKNSPAASVFLANSFREAFAREEDRVFLTGNGMGKPLGVLHSPARLNVARTAAGQIAYADVIAMVKKLLPSSWGRAVWVANIKILDQLLSMTDAANRIVFKMGEGGTRQNTLMGLPIIFTDLTPGLGSEGDLMLCDFWYYAIKDGFGPYITSSPSTQSNFTSGISLVKAVWSVDGQGWIAEPLTLDDGVTQASPFVILSDPL